MSRQAPPSTWQQEVAVRVDAGQRLAGMYGIAQDQGCEITVILAVDWGFETVRVHIAPRPDGTLGYDSLTPLVPAAFWYERALHDLSGVTPLGHPRLDPLLLAAAEGERAPQPGSADVPSRIRATDQPGPYDVSGGGVFTLPFGPVRSGVMESLEILLETPGEDIPHLHLRPHFKHRGIAKRFEGQRPSSAVLVAERVEGICSIAHALAFSRAVERLARTEVPRRARLLRVVYAEVERIANHLDVTMRLADTAGLAVASSRFGWHKERVMRLTSRMCGSRFGRGVVVPGGVTAEPAVPLEEIARELGDLRTAVAGDVAALEGSASFLDRLRGTGVLLRERAVEHGAVGPIGRACGLDEDDRRQRPRDGYIELPAVEPLDISAADALSRARVRWHEIGTSVDLAQQAIERLGSVEGLLQRPANAWEGFAVGSAESPQGEIVYGLTMEEGIVRRCFARSASFHNLLLFHDVFHGDVFTDLPFIEASFGLCYAGVAM